AHLTEFEGKKLLSAAQGDLDTSKWGELSTTVADALNESEYHDLLARLRNVLSDRTSNIRLSRRLTDSPACLVADAHSVSRHLERLLRESGQRIPATKPILEINPDHPIIQRLKRETDQTLFADWAQILFDQCLLAEGTALQDPAGVVKRLNTVTRALAGASSSRIWTPRSETRLGMIDGSSCRVQQPGRGQDAPSSPRPPPRTRP